MNKIKFKKVEYKLDSLMSNNFRDNDIINY